MTPQEEINGLKNLCEGWRRDCQHYAEGLREVRKVAMQYYDASDFETDSWLALIEQINAVLSHEPQPKDNP